MGRGGALPHQIEFERPAVNKGFGGGNWGPWIVLPLPDNYIWPITSSLRPEQIDLAPAAGLRMATVCGVEQRAERLRAPSPWLFANCAVQFAGFLWECDQRDGRLL